MESKYRVLRHNVRANLYNGIAWSIGYNFVLPFTGVMAARMGASNTQFALLSSIPALFTIIATFPAAFIIERFRKQKNIVAGILLFSRICYLLMAMVPWLPGEQLGTLICLVGVYTATSSVISVSWQSMMGEIIPKKYRNRVFAQRNIWAGAFGMLVTLIAGLAIDRIAYPLNYQAAYTIGFLAALAETWFFIRLRIPSEEEPVEQLPEETSFHAAKGGPPPSKPAAWRQFADGWKINAGRPFYLFCASAVVFIFTWQAAWPIYLKVKVDLLHASNTWISIDTVAGGLGSLLGFPLFARYADRKGNAFTIFVCALSLALTPLLWIYAPTMLWPSIYDFVGGIVTAGFNQSVFNRLLEIVPEQARQRAIAIYTSLCQVSAIVAPIVGMKLFELLPYWSTMTTLSVARVIGSLGFLLVITAWLKGKQGTDYSIGI
ncbi:MAG: hypothetical protein JWN30_264 [Bacilli bacterium]|nr:hypothetical protein [Bacilli bacterium]